jgi:hypothetical protein
MNEVSGMELLIRRKVSIMEPSPGTLCLLGSPNLQQIALTWSNVSGTEPLPGARGLERSGQPLVVGAK